MLLGKVCCAIDLRVPCYFNGLMRNLFVEDVVMARSVEKVDERTCWICRNPIGVFRLKDMSIDLRTLASIKVDDLESETYWFQ